MFKLPFPVVYLYVALIVLCETTAMTCFKRSLDNSAFFGIGLLFYACVGFLLCQTYKHAGIAMTNAVWSALSVASTTIVGVMLFKEVLHLHDYFAILLISSGVLILNLTK